MEFNMKEKIRELFDSTNKIIIKISVVSINTANSMVNFLKDMFERKSRKKAFRKMKKGIKKILLIFIKELRIVVMSTIDNFESIVVLVLATTGLSHVIGQIPMGFQMPAFLEGTMVIPTIAVTIMMLLLYLIEKKTKPEGSEGECATSQ